MIKTFIKDLPGIEKLDPEFVNRHDKHFFAYVEMHLSFYEEMKRKGADVFECQNCTTMGKDWAECYEREGHFYHFDEKTCFGKCLSLDGGAGYEDLNWRSLFWDKYPEYHGSKLENQIKSNNDFFHWYMHRYHKKDPKFNIVQDRMKVYFRELSGDGKVIFDVGWHSFIYTDPNIRCIIYWNPSHWY